MGFPFFRWTTVLLSLFLLTALSAISQTVGENRQLKTVVIDPGHGGHDPGAVSGTVKEKELVLSVALRLGNKIKNSFPGVKVIYTRSKDIFIPLYERAAIAIKNKADVFISIHANYVTEPRVRGTETFTLGLHKSQENLDVAKKENSVILLEEDYSANYEGFDPKETESYIMFENLQSEYQSQSIELAANIQEAFTKKIGLNNRGVKQAGFIVLSQSAMPSVLIEIGFISHPEERKFLISEMGREKISESIFQAFSSYKRTIDQRSRFEVASTGGNAATDPPADEQTAEKKEETVLPGENNPGKTLKQEMSEVYYSVQIAAGKAMIDPFPANFKGEKNVFRVKVEPYYKFYSGKFSTPEEANREKSRLNSRYPDAFVVLFENEVPRMYKK